MKFFHAAAALVAALAPVALAQDIVYDAIHNASSIEGTWASGALHVQTGSGFANPANKSFTYPSTAGISYSFIHTAPLEGYFELARYRFVSNGSQPTCITGVTGFMHGTFTLNPNGSISLYGFGDGYQQIQDPCAARSNFIEDYNQTELYQNWRIFYDATTGGNKLHLFDSGGAPLAPQFQVSTTPNMLPTEPLRNVTKSTTSTKSKREVLFRGAKRSAAPRDATAASALVGVLVSAALLATAL